MARIIGGSPFGFLSGKIGGLVAAHNKAGQYLRQYVIPTNPNTGRQAVQRANFANVASLYHTLTGAQKIDWSTWATSGFRPLHGADPGTTYSGQQAFMSSQMIKSVMDQQIEDNQDATPLTFPGGLTVTYDTPNMADFTSPTGILSAAIKDSLGATLPVYVGDVVLYTNGDLELDVTFGSHGGVTQAAAPEFVDANTDEKIGYYVLASKLGTEQVPMFRGEPARMVGAFPNVDITAGWITGATVRFKFEAPAAVDYLDQIKTWYDVNETVQFDVYAVSIDKGNSALVGSFTGQVYAP